MLFYPFSIGIDEFLQERLDRLGQFSRLVERRTSPAQVGFRLLHAGYIEEHHGLAQVMVGTKSAHRAR
ncbi:hypothetical protein D3C86_2144130 [compost metagenome]